MMAVKLSNKQRKPAIGLTLENTVISSEIKDQKMEEIKKFMQLVKNMPDVREDRVNTIKRQLQAGKYKISPEAVVESFIQRHEEICGKSL